MLPTSVSTSRADASIASGSAVDTHNRCERGVPRLERFVGSDQAPPAYDPNAVTVSDIQLPPELAARYGEFDSESSRPKSGDKPKDGDS